MKRFPCAMYQTEKGKFVQMVLGRHFVNLSFPIAESVFAEVNEMLVQDELTMQRLRADSLKHTQVLLNASVVPRLSITMDMEHMDPTTLRYELQCNCLLASGRWVLAAVDEVDQYFLVD